MTGLEDLVEVALVKVGVTRDRVSSWLGKECGCEERKRRLNALTFWAMRTLRRGTRNARVYLSGIMGGGGGEGEDQEEELLRENR